jgi:hypothetical protein
MLGLCLAALKWGLEPGEYTCTLTVKDRLAGRQAKWVKKINVHSPELAIVPVRFASDAKGDAIAPGGGHAGQLLYSKWDILDLGPGPGPGKVNVPLELQVRDAGG